MFRSFEQEICNTSYMQPNHKIIFFDWYMKIDPPMWNTVVFECMNVPLESDNGNVSREKLFLSKSVAIGCNIIKNPDYDNLNLGKKVTNKNCGEDRVEWFMNDMLEMEAYMKKFFKNDSERNPDTIFACVANADSKNRALSTNKCWLR